jgi:large subunit ribosomal protein L22
MLSGKKLKQMRLAVNMGVDDLASALVPAGLGETKARAAVKNWERDNMKPGPRTADIESLAKAMGVSTQNLVVWSACHRYAPMAPRKVRLITDLIRGRSVQDALDVLKFANKRAAVMVDKVLRSAIASADEQEADVEQLYVCQARVDYAGVRLNTRRWRPKDRGRAVSWCRKACHIHVAVDVE